MIIKKYLLIATTLLIGFTATLKAQEEVSEPSKHFIGFGYNLGVNSGMENTITNPGFLYAYKFTPAAAFETGVYVKNEYLNDINTRLRYVEVPLLIKFVNKAVNIGVGTNLDFYTGWKSNDTQTSTAPKDVTKFNVGALATFGHDFALGETLIAEPQLFVSPWNMNGEIYFGLGIRLKMGM